MKADYKNWVPNGMVYGFLGATGVALILTLIFGVAGIVGKVLLVITIFLVLMTLWMFLMHRAC